jgi:predicted  nucleic acid-binding Zn-ribbon protein
MSRNQQLKQLRGELSILRREERKLAPKLYELDSQAERLRLKVAGLRVKSMNIVSEIAKMENRETEDTEMEGI